MRNAVSTRQSFRDEADRAWQDYRDTGLHVTQDEVDAWIDALCTRKPKRRLKPHK